MKCPPLEWKQPVYIIIDPAAGGPRSDFALISLVRQKGMATVIIALLAQWLECWSYEPEVLGSNPRWGTLCLSTTRVVVVLLFFIMSGYRKLLCFFPDPAIVPFHP